MRNAFSSYYVSFVLAAVSLLSSCQRSSYQFQDVVSSSPHTARIFPAATMTAPAASHAIYPAVRTLRPHLRAGRSAVIHRKTKGRVQITTAKRAFIGALPLLRRNHTATARAANRQEPVLPGPYRSKALAILLAVLLGVFGAHLFYLREPGSAVGLLLITLAGVALLVVGAAMTSGALVGGFLLAILVNLLGASAILTTFFIALFDVIRILTGYLKPLNGQFYPRFFQLRPKPGDVAPDSIPK